MVQLFAAGRAWPLRKITRWLLWCGVFVLVIVVLPSAGFVQSEPFYPQHAGIIVSFGDGHVETACVDLGEDGEATGEEVLDASGLAVTKIYESGMGVFVCKIEDDGCPASQCKCQCEDLNNCVTWSYWHLAGDEWHYSVAGASSYIVQAGDVEGWAWGPGQIDNGTKPPVTTFEQICVAPTATPTSEPTSTATDMPTSEPTSTTETEADNTATTEPQSSGDDNGAPASESAPLDQEAPAPVLSQSTPTSVPTRAPSPTTRPRQARPTKTATPQPTSAPTQASEPTEADSDRLGSLLEDTGGSEATTEPIEEAAAAPNDPPATEPPAAASASEPTPEAEPASAELEPLVSASEPTTAADVPLIEADPEEGAQGSASDAPISPILTPTPVASAVAPTQRPRPTSGPTEEELQAASLVQPGGEEEETIPYPIQAAASGTDSVPEQPSGAVASAEPEQAEAGGMGRYIFFGVLVAALVAGLIYMQSRQQQEP